jgi:biofilm PGA synthesis N-glycosyltransferase PgaC
MGGLEVGFWLLCAGLLYTYVGYPVLIAVLARLRARPVRREPIAPAASLLIVAHNEERVIAAKLENCLSQDYPSERLEIVMASDGSTDRTEAITAEFARRSVRLIHFERRRGKASVLNELVPSLTGEIVILSDARQRYAPDAVRQLVMNFADPSVGAASGELCLTGKERSPIGQGLETYWSYEKWMRQSESLVNSTVGATGAIYAIRRTLFRPIPTDTLLDDVLIPMGVVRQGYRVVFDSAAIAYDEVSRSRRQEFVRKVRTIAGNFQAFSRESWLLNPFSNPIWLQTVSHKGLRLVAPLWIIALFALNAALVSVSWFYAGAFGAQLAFYLLALAGFLLERRGRANRLATACYVFCVLNATTLVSFYRFVTGTQRAAWERAG